jgi:hypothetical protein
VRRAAALPPLVFGSFTLDGVDTRPIVWVTCKTCEGLGGFPIEGWPEVLAACLTCRGQKGLRLKHRGALLEAMLTGGKLLGIAGASLGLSCAIGYVLFKRSKVTELDELPEVARSPSQKQKEEEETNWSSWYDDDANDLPWKVEVQTSSSKVVVSLNYAGPANPVYGKPPGFTMRATPNTWPSAVVSALVKKRDAWVAAREESASKTSW